MTSTPAAPIPTVAPAGVSYIYPSPSRGDTATVVYWLGQGGEVSIKVYNQTGRLVDIVSASKSAGWQSTPVNVGVFAPGIYHYMVHVQTPSGGRETQGPHRWIVLR